MLPVVEAGIKYRKPVWYDDVLTIRTSMSGKYGARISLEYEVVRDENTLASGFTEHVFTDPSLKPVKRREIFSFS